MDKKKYILPALAFFSGCCGLGYEVLYNRIFSNIFGDTFSVSFTILATFLSGIALGYVLAHRLKRWLFAVEAGIGVYSTALMFLILRTGSLTSGRLFSVLPVFPFSSVVYAFLLLILPSLLIGVSIPVLSRYMFNEKSDRPFDRTYYLYNAGAALTVLAIEYVLLQHLPISQSLYVLGLVNLAIGIVLFLLRDVYRDEKVTRIDLKLIDRRRALALFLFSMVSAAYQLLLLKLNSFVFGPFRENFSITVFVAVLFISLGTYVQSKRHFSFKALLSAGIFSIILEIFLFKLSAFFLALVMGFAGGFTVLSVLIKIFWTCLWGLPLLVTGMSVPVLLKEMPSENIENTSGLLLFYSSAGNVFGYVVMFFFIHPFLTYGTMFAALVFLVALTAVTVRALSLKTAIKAAVLLAAGLFFFWDEKLLYISHVNFLNVRSFLNEYHATEKIEPFKAYNQTLAIVTKNGGKKTFFINGYYSVHLDHAVEREVGVTPQLIDMEANPIEKVVGVMPRLIDTEARNALVLGLGAGLTAGAASPAVKEVDVVEINEAVVRNQAIRRRDLLHLVRQRVRQQRSFILLNTFLSSFRNAGIIGLRDSYYLLFGSEAPFPLQAQRNAALTDYLTAVAGTRFKLDVWLLSRDIRTKETERMLQALPVNTIDAPVLENTLARLGPNPSFYEVKKWLSEVTASTLDPLTGSPFTEGDLERRYIHHGLYLPFLGPKEKYLLREPHRMAARKDSVYALQKADRKKIPLEFFSDYLENRWWGRHQLNADLLKKSAFPGKDIFTFDLALKGARPAEAVKSALSLCLKDDKNATALSMAGISLVEMQNFSQGVDFLKHALARDPFLLRVRLYLASVYFHRLHDEKKAKALLSFIDLRSLSDFDVLEQTWLLNKDFSEPLLFSKNPWLKEGFSLPKDAKSPPSAALDYDFVFFDLLRQFYQSSGND